MGFGSLVDIFRAAHGRARMVAAGLGLSSVPESTIEAALRNKTVGLVKLAVPQPSATLGLVYRKASRATCASGCFATC